MVCGAPNARTGMKGVFAAAGSYIPGTDMTLKPGKIRGEASNGMLVSEREMGLSDEHEGIIELPEDAAVGTPFARSWASTTRSSTSPSRPTGATAWACTAWRATWPPPASAR